MRFIALVLGVFLVRAAVALVIGWLAHRPRASWTPVAAVANTVILLSVAAMILQFRDEGVTVFSVCVALLMVWLAYSAAAGGNLASLAIKANRAPDGIGHRPHRPG